jgi:hypothetical protein
MLLVFWSAPLDEDVEQFRIFRSNTQSGPFEELIIISSRDGYDNWITHYEDDTAPSAAFYRVEYLKESIVVETSPVKAGVTPYPVTPQCVIDNIQGIPLNRISAEMIQRQIRWAVEWVEIEIQQHLSAQTVTKEIYGPNEYRKVLGARAGQRIQLRHWPVISVEKVYYRIRGASQGSQDQELVDLDIQIEDLDNATGYNHGQISIWPRSVSVAALFAGLTLTSDYNRYAVSILVDYTHGYVTWPRGVEQLVTEMAAAFVMEVAGEAETAGLSSRSVDGYAESYTASATTTVFSARRIWYEQHAEKLKKLHRKPKWG